MSKRMDNEEPQEEESSGAPAWVMTFADLMSLLLAFFVLLFSFSEMDKAKYKEVGGSMKDAFGVQREVVVRDQVMGISFIAEDFSSGKPEPTLVNSVKQETTLTRDPNLKVKEVEMQTIIEQHIDEELKEAIKQARQFSQKAHIVLDEDLKKRDVELDTRQNIVIIRMQETSLFRSGQAKILEDFKPVLHRIGMLLELADDSDVAISGHADNRPINTPRFRSNWELSASRAVSVLHEITTSVSLDLSRMKVQGMAHTRPIADNKTPAGRARNRRVEIKIEFGKDQEENVIIDEEQTAEGENILQLEMLPMIVDEEGTVKDFL
jgi:chemotaxis protein MotB